MRHKVLSWKIIMNRTRIEREFEKTDDAIPITSWEAPSIKYRKEGGCMRREFFIDKNGINIRCANKKKK